MKRARSQSCSPEAELRSTPSQRLSNALETKRGRSPSLAQLFVRDEPMYKKPRKAMTPERFPSYHERLRILSLDGGGARGLSSLLILRELMERLKESRTEARAFSTTMQQPPRPCEVFDLIIGTGTGGISALLLGCLGLSIQDAIDEYIRMADTVFIKTSFLGGRSNVYHQETLKTHLRMITEKYLGDPDALISDSAPCQCRVAVPAASPIHADAPPFFFRNYSYRQSFKIVDVALATSATAGLFPAVSLGHPPNKYIDAGSVGYGNPTEIALAEAHDIWPAQSIGVILSLGTGSQRIVDAGHVTDLTQISQSLIENCELVHERVSKMLSHSSYFRFSVDRGLDTIGVEDWRDVNRLADITDGYIRMAGSVRDLKGCVESIRGTTGCVCRELIVTGDAGTTTNNNTSLDMNALKGLPTLDTWEVEPLEVLSRGKGYRFYSAKTGGKAVIYKVFEGTHKERNWITNVTFCRRVAHPSLLHLIAISSPSSDIHSLVFNGACRRSIEYLIADALQTNLARSVRLGFKVAHDLSAGLSYLTDQDIPLMIELQHYDIFLGEDDNVKIGFNPTHLEEHQGGKLSGSSATASVNKDLDIFNRLVRRTLHAANQVLYREQLANGQSELDTEISFEQQCGRLPTPLAPETSFEIPAIPPRREYRWRVLNKKDLSLEDISLQFRNVLAVRPAASLTPSGLPRVRARNARQTTHICDGYIREEITLAADITANALVSYTTPAPREICIICGISVQDTGTFRCICGTNSEGRPTIQCTRCSTWSHRGCVPSHSRFSHYVCSDCKAEKHQQEPLQPLDVLRVSSASLLTLSSSTIPERISASKPEPVRPVVPPHNTFRRFGSLNLGMSTRKWQLSSVFARKNKQEQPDTVPPFDKYAFLSVSTPAPARETGNNMLGHGETGGSISDNRSHLDVSSVDSVVSPAMSPKRLKKERERQAREAEMARRAHALKSQRERARAVMQKRNDIIRGSAQDSTIDWQWTYPKVQTTSTHGLAGVELRGKQGEPMINGEQDYQQWLRCGKAWRRDLDDDHAISWSEVDSIMFKPMSVVSVATIDSEPFPRQSHRGLSSIARHSA